MRTRVVLLLLLAFGTVFVPTAAHDVAPAPVAAPTAAGRPAPGSPALDVLRGWDARRAWAWAAGDPDALRGLYVRGSPAARADVALLRRYLARGLVVTGMSRQLLAARVVRRSEHRITVRVTDRLVGARAGGVRLPASAPVTPRIDLVRAGAVWRVAGIRRVARL